MAAQLSDRFDAHSVSQESSSEHHNIGIDELTDDQLLMQIDEICNNNRLIALENTIFDKYFKKLEPFISIQTGGTATSSLSTTPSGSMYDVTNTTTGGVTIGGTGTVGGTGGGRSYRKRSKSRSIAGDFRMRLSSEQKCDIVSKEIEELKVEIQRIDDESEKELDTYRAILEEAEIRCNEIKKDIYEFDRDVYKGGLNQTTKKVLSERFFKYLDEKLKEKDTAIEKTRLKNTGMKKQKNALIKQLRQKEELGEVLLEVDFKQLKIENKQYLEKIEEKNTEMTKLKKMVGVVTQMLNYKKKQQNQFSKAHDAIMEEIRIRKSILEKLTSETEIVKKEHEKEEMKNRGLREQLENYKVPEVNDYVKAEAESNNLEKELKIWERKVEIAEMAYKINKQTWIQLRSNKNENFLIDPLIKSSFPILDSKQYGIVNKSKELSQMQVAH